MGMDGNEEFKHSTVRGNGKRRGKKRGKEGNRAFLVSPPSSLCCVCFLFHFVFNPT